MLQSGAPAKIPLPWANGATGSYIEAIPVPSQQGGGTPGKASFTDGFPPDNFVPVASGGIPPYGADFNGILQQITAGLQYLQAGSLPQYDAGFSADIGGYPKGCVLASTTLGQYWVSTIDGNATNPDASGANWQSLFIGLAPIASPAFTGVPTVPTPAAGTTNAQAINAAFASAYFAAIAGSVSQPFNMASATTSTEGVPAGQIAALHGEFYSAASGTFTVPALVTAITIEAWGAGGGGAGSPTLLSTQNAGTGGGGAYGRKRVAVTPGQVIAFTIGAGGAAGAFGGNDGGAGGTTTISGYFSVSGGSGGVFNSGAATAGGPAPSGVDIGIAGMQGSPGAFSNTVPLGIGGSSPRGGGGGPASGVGVGASGIVPGGGGGAGMSQSGAISGGAGASGAVLITW